MGIGECYGKCYREFRSFTLSEFPELLRKELTQILIDIQWLNPRIKLPNQKTSNRFMDAPFYRFDLANRSAEFQAEFEDNDYSKWRRLAWWIDHAFQYLG